MNQAFIGDIPDALLEYPQLKVEGSGENLILKGDIDLVYDGVYEDTYTVEIHQTEKFPFQFPLVFETGGRIPKNIDWHVYDTGNLCIAVSPEEMIACNKGLSLKLFIRTRLKPYLYNQTFRRRNGYFYRERSHGDKGILEYYQEVFKEQNAFKVIEFLRFIATKPEPKRTGDCFCKSGKKYRKCHRDTFRELSKVGNGKLLYHAQKFDAIPKPLLIKWSGIA